MKKSVKVLIVILCLIILGLMGFIVWDKVLNNKNDNTTNVAQNNTIINSNKNVNSSTTGNTTNQNTNNVVSNTDNKTVTNNIQNTTSKNNVNSSENNTPKEYTETELISMALKYYEAKNGNNPGHAMVDGTVENGMITIRIYEDYDDHIATLDYYTVDTKTAKGTDRMGNEIDLKNNL